MSLTSSLPTNSLNNPIEVDQSHPYLDNLRLTGKLQESLDTESILNLFVEEAKKTIAFDGLIFSSPTGKAFKQGRRAKTHSHFRLRIHEILVGELAFYRRTVFQQQDIILLEQLLCELLYPLRNASLYEQALENALNDPLTGVNNRGSFDISLQREVELAKRHQTNLTILVIDIDDFKRVNDQYGHSVGDQVLKHVVSNISGCTRRSDLLFRYGGEEFVLILSNTKAEGGFLLAERIRQKIQDNHYNSEGIQIEITVSIGTASLDEHGNGQGLFQNADKAMYQAKKHGKNLVQSCENISVV